MIVLLPGPPRELKTVFDNKVLPGIEKLCGGMKLAYRSFHVTGITESELDSQIAPIYTAYPQVRTTVLAGTRHIAVRLYRWTQAGEIHPDLDELASKIQDKLGDAIFTTCGESMEEVVGRQLRESGRTLAVAESCTAGMLGMHITRVPGSSSYFLGGILCYSNDAKMKLCGVPAGLLEKHGAVSAEVAEALARGCPECPAQLHRAVHNRYCRSRRRFCRKAGRTCLYGNLRRDAHGKQAPRHARRQGIDTGAFDLSGAFLAAPVPSETLNVQRATCSV